MCRRKSLGLGSKAAIERPAYAEPPVIGLAIAIEERLFRLSARFAGGADAVLGKMPQCRAQHVLVGMRHACDLATFRTVVIGHALGCASDECLGNRRAGRGTARSIGGGEMDGHVRVSCPLA